MLGVMRSLTLTWEDVWQLAKLMVISACLWCVVSACKLACEVTHSATHSFASSMGSMLGGRVALQFISWIPWVWGSQPPNSSDWFTVVSSSVSRVPELLSYVPVLAKSGYEAGKMLALTS